MFSSINLDALKRQVPSVFTETSSNQTSDKYKHISTANLVQGLLNEGFVPTWGNSMQNKNSG